jgi:hypothetical protein
MYYERHGYGKTSESSRCGPCERRAAAVLQGAVAAMCCKLVNWALHNPYCGLLFRCGCTWPWAGGWAGCNFHNPAGPRCPWCNVHNTNLAWLAPAISSQFTVVAMLAAYVAVWLGQLRHHVVRPMAYQIAMRGAAAVGMFAVLGLALGWLFYAYSTPEYPCFLWIVDEETHCGGKAR